MDPHHSSSPNINICRRCLILLLGWALISQLNAQPKPQVASDVDVCVAKPECTGKDTQKQRFPTPDNCTSYFECRGNNLQTRECQRGFIFDHDDSECKKNIDCQIECDHSVQVCEQNVLVPVQCKSSLLPERNYSDTTDCQKYYQCRTGKLFSLECPSNNLFDSESNTCVVRGTETCEACGESIATPAPPSTPSTAAPKDPDNLVENTVAPGPAEITTQTTQSTQTEAPTTSESPPTPEPPKPPLKPCAPFSCSKQEDNGKDAPHPSDCTKYRECNIDTILVRDCAIGSSFDVDQLICINKDEAKCAPECVPTSDEATGGSENEADAPTSAAPAKTTEPTTQTTAAPPVVTQPAKEPTTKAAVGGPDALTSGPSDGNIEPEVTVPQESENTTIPPGPGESSTPDAGIADPATTTTVPTKGPIIEPSPPLIDTGDPTTTTTTAAATTTTLLGPIPDPTTTPQGPVIEPSFPGIDTGDPTTTSTTTTTTTVTPPTTKIVSNEPVSNPGDPGAPTSPPVVTPSPNPTEPADPVIQHSITTLHDDEPFVREGSDGTFTCRAFLPKKVLEDDMQILQPNPRIVWALKATKLMASARVQIRTDDYSSMSELISSRIIINNMEPKDSGNLTCTVMHENKVISEKVRLVPVLGRPSASISVSLNAVTPGETVSATCKVNQPSSLVRVRAADILWYKDRRFLSRSDDEVLRENQINIDDLSRETSILRLVVSERTEISCSALNGAGSSDIASKIINVVKQGIEQNVYCPEEVDGGVTWRRTLAGSEVIINCSLVHERAKGEIVRMCKRSADNEGVWGTANHGQCVTEEFKEILTEIENIEDSLTPINETQLQHVTNHVVEKTKSKDPLLPGDINIAVEVIGKVADIRKRQEMALPVEQLNVTMTSVSNLLDDKNLDSWKNLTEEEPNAGANILSAVDTLIEQSVKVLEPGTNKTISTPNVVMMMESMSKDKTTTVQFPPIMKNSQQSWMKRQGDFIKLEKDTLDYVKNDIAGSMLNISGVYYRNLDKILSTEGEREHVNSKVVALTVYGLDNHARLKPPVSLKFTLEKEYPNDKMNNCSFWNFDIPPKGAWSTIGCRTILSEDLTTATCQCDHLTNFAMLVSSSPVSAQHHYILSMISLVGCIISMVSLLLTMLFYGSMWSAVKSHHAAVLINLCVALLFGNLVFIAGVERTEIKLVCTIIAALLHYFWLAAFFIMLVEGIQLLLYIIYVFHVRRKRDTVALLIGGWVFPGIIVGISLAVTSMEGYGTEEACWLSPVSGLLWAFVGPVLCVILVNMIIIVIVLRRALSAKIPTAKKKNKLRSAVWNIMVITPLLGITWILGVFSVNEDTLAFQYIFAICNSLQGLFIFIFHALCNKKLRDAASSSSGHPTASTVKNPFNTGKKNKSDSDKLKDNIKSRSSTQKSKSKRAVCSERNNNPVKPKEDPQWIWSENNLGDTKHKDQ